MRRSIGIIAEDISDVEVIRALIVKRASSRPFTINKFVGHGCGKIRGKCRQWAATLSSQGCNFLIVLHDLDNKPLGQLTNDLRNSLRSSPIKNHVIAIPVQMVEAWLLSDNVAIHRGMNLSLLPKEIANPEALLDPKSKLRDIIFQKSGKKKSYLNTIHNPKIAKELSMKKLFAKCESFRPLDSFLSTVFS